MDPVERHRRAMRFWLVGAAACFVWAVVTALWWETAWDAMYPPAMIAACVAAAAWYHGWLTARTRGGEEL